MNTLSKKTISIIVPAYNEARYIEGCLRSLLAQTRKADEIIVVDNNSTDETENIVKKFTGVKIYKESTPGVGAARRRGFKEASGDILVSTDADTKPPENWVQNILDIFEKRDIAAVTGPFLFYDRGKFWNGLTRMITPVITTLDWWLGRGSHHLLGMNFAIRRKAYEATQGFNKALKYGEDIDLAKKVKKIGKIVYTKKLRVYTHSRRYQPSLAFARYLMNFIKTTSTGKPFRNELPKVERGKKQ